MRDDLTDVPGFRVGSAEDLSAATGCTVILAPDDGAAGGVDQRGGAPGTRETDPLRPLHLVERCHAVLLTGGSAFGLEAAGGVAAWLERRGIGFKTSVASVPIVPAAVLYDLAVGRPDRRPDPEMGEAACREAERGEPVRLGNAGAGCGATVGKIQGIACAMKGGLGSASDQPAPGLFVGAVVAVNAFGDVVDPATGGILAGTRISGADPRSAAFADTLEVLRRDGGISSRFGVPDPNTVIGVVATNGRLDKQGANLLARAAGIGLARAIRPAHTRLDGDTIFALSAGERPCDPTLLGAVAAEVMARAIVRAVLRAETLAGVPAAGETGGSVEGIRIRPAGESDREGIAAVMRGLPEWFRPDSIGEAMADLSRHGGLVAEIAGRIVGFAIHGPSDLYPEPGLVKVHWIGVARSHRRHGIGRALTRVVEDECRRAGGGAVELMTVASSEAYPPYDETRAFYRAAGYREYYNDPSARREYGCEMVHLRKEIAGGSR